MASIMQILRRIGGAKATPTGGSAGQIALWKAGTAKTDAASLYAHDGVQWNEIVDTSAQWTAKGADVYRAAGNVGIGAAPAADAKLEVHGKGVFVNGACKGEIWPAGPLATDPLVIGTTTNGDVVFYANNAEVFRVTANGRFGIGNPIPGTKFAAGMGTDMVAIDNPAASTTRLSLGSDPTLAASPVTAHTEIQYNRVAGETAINVVSHTGAVAQAIHIGSTGHVGIGGPSSTFPFAVVAGSDAAYANVAGAVSYFGLGEHGNPTGANFSLMFDRASGLVTIMGGPRDSQKNHLSMNVVNGVLNSPPTYANVLAGSNVVVDAAGTIGRASSSAKYKKDVEDLDAAITENAIRSLRPVWYRSKKAMGDDKAHWSHIGLIAEEVAKVEPRLVNFKTVEVSQVDKPLTNDDGTQVLDGEGKPRTMPEQVVTPLETPEPEDVDYARLSVLLLDYVQRLEKRVAALEARS